MANFWEDIVGSVTSGVKDLFSDKDTYRDLLSVLISEDPKMSKKQQARLLAMMNPNVESVMGSQYTDIDPQTGQATVRRVIPEGSLNMLNSRMQRWAEGPNFWDAPQAMYDHGDQLFKYRQAAQGMPETGAEWWRPPEPRTFEFVPFQNPGGAPHTGGSGAGGGVPGGGDLGEQLGPGVGDPADRIPQGNQEWMDRYYEGRHPFDMIGDTGDIPYMDTPLDERLQDLVGQLPSDLGRWLATEGAGMAQDIMTGPYGIVGDAAVQALASAYCAVNACTESEIFSVHKDIREFLEAYGQYFDERDMSEDLGATPDVPGLPGGEPTVPGGLPPTFYQPGLGGPGGGDSGDIGIGIPGTGIGIGGSGAGPAPDWWPGTQAQWEDWVAANK